MKQYYLWAALSITTILVAMGFVKKETAYPDKHLEIVLRNIGHEVLLHSRDSTSRVLPIKTVDENTFQISFENRFGFIPDTLMNVVHEQLAKSGRMGDYTVSVKECAQHQTIFAYEENTTTGNLKPCKGRELKKGCYVIEISFLSNNSFNWAWLLPALVPIIFAGIYYTSKRKNGSKPTESKQEMNDDVIPVKEEAVQIKADYIQVGNFQFLESKGMLSHNGETIELSAKESKALNILVSNLNEVVGRDLLMKALWEDEGVVVISRNVDVLISKLRKRLSADPDVKIVNVPGKGYKMIV